jgi:hypothetical protein
MTSTPREPGAPESTMPARVSGFISDLSVFWRALSALLFIGFVVWLFASFGKYSTKYAQSSDVWRVGGTHLIEITLIPEDVRNLACSSDAEYDGLRCGFHRNGSPFGSSGSDDATTIRPYNTVKNELFLAAGLWSSEAMKRGMPRERFSITCNYSIVGVTKSVSLRWGPTASFGPVQTSVPVGRLSNCVFPQ